MFNLSHNRKKTEEMKTFGFLSACFSVKETICSVQFVKDYFWSSKFFFICLSQSSYPFDSVDLREDAVFAKVS